MNKIFDISLKAKTIGLLFLSMFFMALATTIIVSIQSKEVLLKKSEASLMSSREVKANQIEDFFKKRLGDINVLSRNANVHSTLAELIYLHKELDVKPTDPYPVDEMDVDDVIEKYDEFFHFYAKEYGYYDIYVICPVHGHVMYSKEKVESDWGTNLSTGPIKNSPLAKVWKKVRDLKRPVFVDMQPYGPSKGAPTMFMGAPVMMNGFLKGVVVFNLSD